MARLTPQQRASRLAFDWQVAQAMNGPVFAATAYRSPSDLEAGRNPVTTPEQAAQALVYRVEFHVPTLAGRGKPLQPTTVVGFNLGTGDYPYEEPATWIIGAVPYSPHFRSGAPVCIGELWREGRGRMLLGQLLVHVAKILNWDEESRGRGYVGWNGDAITLHQEGYGNSPIDPGLIYPPLPVHLTHGFDPAGAAGAGGSDLFGPAASARPLDASQFFVGGSS